MVSSLRFVGAACLGLALAALPSGLDAQAVTPLVLPRPAQPLLPNSFAGWSASAPPHTGTSPESSDRPDADILGEYGMKDYAVADYTRAGRHLTLLARRFGDATGAYGAFTFYRKPEMHAEHIGSEAAAGKDEVIFWTGATVVDALFDNAAPDNAALRQLATVIPPASGSESVPPSLPRYLPTDGLEAGSVRYSIG